VHASGRFGCASSIPRWQPAHCSARAAGPIKVTIAAPVKPKVNVPWKYTVTVKNAKGKLVAAKLSMVVIDPIGTAHPVEFFKKKNPEAIMRTVQAEVKPPRLLWPACPLVLEDVCMQLLQKNKEDRPPGAEVVAAEEGALALVQARDASFVNVDLAAGRRINSGDQVEQGALAAPAAAADGGELAGREGGRGLVENGARLSALGKVLAQFLELNQSSHGAVNCTAPGPRRLSRYNPAWEPPVPGRCITDSMTSPERRN